MCSIQGLVVNTVPSSDPRYNPKYDSIYNHGYGTLWGTQGANCHHQLYPYIEGVSTNPFHHPDTEQAIENGKVQQKQRALERRIRDDKKSLKYAKDLKDVGSSYKYKNHLNRHRSELLNLVNDNSFLHRDYKREKIATELSDKKKKDIRFSIKTDEAYLRQLKEEFGRHGLPDNVEEYRRLIYNKDSSRAVKAYIQARQSGVVEPVVTYKDFIDRTKELDNRIVGMTANDGTVITDYSNHMIARTFGAMHDQSHNNNKRVGVSVDDNANNLKMATLLQLCQINKEVIRMAKIHFQKGDLEFIKKEFPETFEELKPIVNSDMTSVNVSTDEEREYLETSLDNAMVDDKSLDGIELNKFGLRVESIIDYVHSNNE